MSASTTCWRGLPRSAACELTYNCAKRRPGMSLSAA